MQPIEAAEPSPRRAKWRSLPRWRNWLAWYFAPAAVILALVVIWEIAVVALRVPRVILPAPTAVLAQLTQNPGFLLTQAGNTALETLLGFLLSLLIGVPLAVAIVYSRFLENTLYTMLVVLNSVPKVAVAPLFIIWMGTGLAPKVAIALMIALFPIVIDTVVGLRSVPPEMLDLARSMGGRPTKVFWKIRLPAALPNIFAGAKVAISLAIVGAIVGEFVGADRGLGYVIMTAQGTFNTARIFAAITILGIMGIVMFYAVEFTERRLLPWHVSRRGQAVTPTP
jgi:NitT/TauT family transport system permease protein